MKTIRTIAAFIIAAVLVLGPAVAFGATSTMTLSTNAPSYSGQSTIVVTGTISPAPTMPNTAVVITTTGPAGAVDIGEATVATGTGAFTYTFVSGGTTSWTTGTYTINGTWGAQGNTATKTTTFTYSGGISTGSSGTGAGPIDVQVTASTPVWPGQQVDIGILTSFSNGSLAPVTFQTVHYHTPQDTLVELCFAAGQVGCTGTFVTIHTGFYEINFTAPTNMTAGGYFVHAWVNGPVIAGSSTGQGQGLGQFTVNPNIAQQSSVSAISTSLGTLTTTVGSIQTTLNTLSASFGGLNTAIQGLTTSIGSLSTLQSNINTISSGVSSIQSTLTGLQTSIGNVSNIGSQLTTLTNSVNNDQTYVLVVAALAAITLVLELAILVRKLS
jgi:hypothetical protein